MASAQNVSKVRLVTIPSSLTDRLLTLKVGVRISRQSAGLNPAWPWNRSMLSEKLFEVKNCPGRPGS